VEPGLRQVEVVPVSGYPTLRLVRLRPGQTRRVVFTVEQRVEEKR